MNYEKPKVTIDLAEYMELKETVKTLKRGDLSVLLEGLTPFAEVFSSSMAFGPNSKASNILQQSNEILNKNGYVLGLMSGIQGPKFIFKKI